MMHFVYILKNAFDDLYVGVTKDPIQRLAYHNERRGALFTKRNSKFDIAFLEKYCPQFGFLTPSSPEFFLWSAFVEEVVKFYAVRLTVLNDPEFDEPIDAMVYMMAAALGFAAIENTLIVFQTHPEGVAVTTNTLILRFIGATLLHALSSGLLGYFLAISWFFQHHRKKLIFIGLFMATIFHFTFNIIIFAFEKQVSALLYTTSLLLGMAFLISILFDRLKSRHTSLPYKFTRY